VKIVKNYNSYQMNLTAELENGDIVDEAGEKLIERAKKIIEETDIRLVGLGVGRGTEHVGEYYPNSIANVKVKEMAEKLADLIKEVVANYDKF